MFITEAVTISDIEISKKYPYVRKIHFKDRLYQVVIASNVLYDIGEEVLFCPDGTKLPIWLLQHLNLWNTKENVGMLSGKHGNVVKPYLFARDPEMFSSGFIIKAPSGILEAPNGAIEINDKDLVEKAGITYIRKGNPYYFSGDIFYMDVPVVKNTCVDLEYAYKKFEGKYVRYQEYIPGRKFYIIINRNKMHHSAFGTKNNIYVCGENYGKFRFLSNTKKNLHGNLYVKLMRQLDLERYIEHYFYKHSVWNQMTLGVVIKTTAFGAKTIDVTNAKDKISLVDMYIDNVPFGRYLPQSEFDAFCSSYNFPSPEYEYEDFYSTQKAYELLTSGAKTGIVIRTEDNYDTAVLYSIDARMKFIHKNS